MKNGSPIQVKKCTRIVFVYMSDCYKLVKISENSSDSSRCHVHSVQNSKITLIYKTNQNPLHSIEYRPLNAKHYKSPKM